MADYGHRAIHETAVTAKALINAFYGAAPRFSYFNACSNGGRAALMEAQRYPDDYDGIVAAAPALSITRALAAFEWNPGCRTACSIIRRRACSRPLRCAVPLAMPTRA